MAQRFVRFIFGLRDRANAPDRPRYHPALRQAIRLAGLWLAYVAGAAAGGWSWMNVGLISLWGPIIAVGVIAALALIWPVPLP